MKKIGELTEQEFTGLLNEFYAPAEKRTKMTKEEIKALAIKVNPKVNIPLIKESNEEKILIKVIMKIDNFLYDNLPNEFYDLMRSLDDGIDDIEAKRLAKSLAKLANDKIDIPYIPEPAEYVVFRIVIGVIINAARKQWDIHKAMSTEIPANSDQRESTDSLIIN